MTPEEVFLDFPELSDCAPALSGQEIGTVCEMLVRHGKQVLDSFARAAGEQINEIVSGSVSPTALLTAIAPDIALRPAMSQEEPPTLTPGQEGGDLEYGLTSRLAVCIEGPCPAD